MFTIRETLTKLPGLAEAPDARVDLVRSYSSYLGLRCLAPDKKGRRSVMRALITSKGTSGSSVSQLSYLYTTFEGRISRGQFWWGGSLMLAAQVTLSAAIARAVGLGWRDFVYSDRRAMWVYLVVVAFFFWPSLALCIKRLHDRDLPGWWAALLHVLLFIFCVDQAATRPLMRDNATVLISLLPVTMLFLVSAWLLVELAFLNGTAGANRFGPHPLGSPLPEPDRTLLAASAAPRPGE